VQNQSRNFGSCATAWISIAKESKVVLVFAAMCQMRVGGSKLCRKRRAVNGFGANFSATNFLELHCEACD